MVLPAVPLPAPAVALPVGAAAMPLGGVQQALAQATGTCTPAASGTHNSGRRVSVLNRQHDLFMFLGVGFGAAVLGAICWSV